MRKSLGVGLAVLAFCLLGVTAPNSAHAYTFTGCKYGGSNPNIDVDVNATNAYSASVTFAADQWNAESVPGVFDLTPGSAAINLRIDQLSSVSSAWAWTIYGCPGAGDWDHYDNYVEIALNDSEMWDLTSYQRQLVIEHELGHAYGLNHQSINCNGIHAVMIQGTYKWTCGWSGTAPWQDDADGVKARY